MEFYEYGKMPRLFRDITVTEKIDGTNGAIHIELAPNGVYSGDNYHPIKMDGGYVATAVKHPLTGIVYGVGAQSRNQLITPQLFDSFGFAKWVRANAQDLVRYLPEGIHAGEWWGSGIQRKYGLTGTDKRFSLFNTHKWSNIEEESNGLLRCVPILYEGMFSEEEIRKTLENLKNNGSVAAPGYKNPEGVVVYHHSMKQTAKITLDKNDKHKWETEV